MSEQAAVPPCQAMSEQPAVPPCQVLIFGDSWAAYPAVPKTWPMQLADHLGVQAMNFAVPGSRTDQLLLQLEDLITSPEAARTPTGDLDPSTVAVIHSAGNDFMQRVRMGAVTEIFREFPGEEEAKTIKALMQSLYSSGVRTFIVADVPLSKYVPGIRLVQPLIQGMVRAGRLEHLGVESSDPAELAVELQATALHDRWEQMLDEFRGECKDASVVHFDESFALTRLREAVGADQFDRSFFDMTMIHPSAYGHTLLAQEAHRCMQQVACS
jgi:hypothetical protein